MRSEVHIALTTFEANRRDEQGYVEDVANPLFEAGQDEAASV